MLNNINLLIFLTYIFVGIQESLYICIVFFMVLDLRLTMEIGCRDDNLFLFYILL